MKSNELGKIIDIETEIYENSFNRQKLNVTVKYENGEVIIPKINLDLAEISKKYTEMNSSYYVPRGIASCDLVLPIELTQGIYATIKMYPEVSKVYNLSDNLIVGIDQSKTNDKTILCFSKFENGKFTVIEIKTIVKQVDINEYINQNKDKWLEEYNV